ncbi:unnamed protein product, partial [Medioppia subpectinata]
MFGNGLTGVVLSAGKGSRMAELTANWPKGLLPVANKPLIYYPLEALIKAGFQGMSSPHIVSYHVIYVLTYYLMNKALNELKLDIRIDLVSIPYNRDFGTADSLRLIKDKIKNDVLVLSCDTITDFPLKRLIDFYRIHNPTLLALISSIPYNNENSIPGRKGREKIEKDLIGIDAQNGDRLVFMSSEADFDESVSFSVSMLKKCPQMTIKSNLLDAHIYLLKKWTLRYLEENTQISSLKGEFLPSLVRKQFRREVKTTLNKTNTNPSSIISMSALPHRQIFDFIETNDIELGLRRLEPNMASDDLNAESLIHQMPNSYPESKITCFAYRLDEGYCVRANTVSGYCEANRIQLRQMNASDRKTVKHQNSIKSQVDAITGNVKAIGEKCLIK